MGFIGRVVAIYEKTNPRLKMTPEGDGFSGSVTFVIFARDSFNIFIIFQALS